MKISIEIRDIDRDLDEPADGSHESLDYETIRDSFRNQPDPVDVEKLDAHSFLLRIYSTFPEIVGLRIENDDPKHVLVIPPFINQFTTIENLYLVGKITLPPEIWGLTNLKTLDISNNDLQSLPAELGNLVNLQTLKVQNNELKKVCPEIGRLINLTLLSLPSNSLTKLPDEIGKLKKLQRLFLSDNALSTLPAEMTALINLRELQLANNRFEYFPDVIGHFIGLEVLDISNNIEQPRNRSSNQLNELPSAIGRLTKLSKFNLSGNKLTGLPVEFKRLARLSELDLSRNQLAVLTPVVCDLAGLKILNLSGNTLSTLPAEIQNLGKLEVLLLQNNQFLSLPESIKELKKLRKLDVQGNGFPLLFSGNNNPNWFISSVKNLTRDKVVLQNQGRLTTQLINQLIDEIENDSDYSQQQRSYLISFLREYDFYLDVLPKQIFLVPEAISPNFNINDQEWNSATSIQISYNDTPSNVFTMLIIRLAPYIHNNQIWQSGVILQKGDSTALIKVDVDNKTILVKAKGKDTCQEFLSIICFELETIHRLLQINAKIPEVGQAKNVSNRYLRGVIRFFSVSEPFGQLFFDLIKYEHAKNSSKVIVGWLVIIAVMAVLTLLVRGVATFDEIIKWVTDLTK